MDMLPEVRDFGMTRADLFGVPLPIMGVAGDQQAATIGQACFAPGKLKSTSGSGCFALLNTGDTLVRSQSLLLGAIAYQLDGELTYALEGSIFIACAVVQWLRDGLKQEFYIVSAFTGLGAPHWDAEARGAIYGLTRNSGPEEFARAALDSFGFQTRDLLEEIKSDWQSSEDKCFFRVCGGMSASDWSMHFLSTLLARLWIALRFWQLRPWGLRGLQGCVRGFILIRRGLRRSGRLSVALSHKWMMRRARRFAGRQDAVRAR